MGNNGYEARVCSVITDTVTESLDWLPPSIGSASTTAEGQVTCGSGGGFDSSDGESAKSCGDATEVLVNLPLAGSSALLPQINLPPFGKVPPVGLSNVTGLACVTL